MTAKAALRRDRLHPPGWLDRAVSATSRRMAAALRNKGSAACVRPETIFNKLLSLQGAFVRHVEFLKDDTILVGVERRTRLHRCPSCDFRTVSMR